MIRVYNNTYEMLEQDSIWITRDRMPIRLVDMDPQHRRNTLAFLRRSAKSMSKAYFYCLARAFLTGELLITDPDIDHFNEVHVTNDAEVEINITPEEWLEKRPLVIALARLVKHDELEENTVEGEVVEERPSLPPGRAFRL